MKVNIINSYNRQSFCLDKRLAINDISGGNVQERLTNKQKVLIGVGVFGGASALGYFILKGKRPKLNNLAVNIEFKPAETIEEAVKFSKEILKIPVNKIKDLEIANLINESLVKINNFSKGKSYMPKGIMSLSDCKNLAVPEGSVAAIVICKGSKANNINEYLLFNDDFSKNTNQFLEQNIGLMLANGTICANGNGDKYLARGFENNDIFKSTSNLLKRYFDKDETLTKMDKMNLNCNLLSLGDEYANFLSYPTKKLSEFQQNPEMKKLIGAYMPVSIDNFKKIDINNQRKMMINLLNEMSNQKIYPLKVNKYDAEDLIFHEMGHLQHFYSNPTQEYSKIFAPEIYRLNRESLPENLIEFISSSDKRRTAFEVSTYASLTPTEFVAETFRGLANGRKFSQEVMDMYKFYKGPAVA